MWAEPGEVDCLSPRSSQADENQGVLLLLLLEENIIAVSFNLKKSKLQGFPALNYGQSFWKRS